MQPYLPAVLSDVQGLVFHHPVDVRLGVSAGLAVKNGGVSLVHSCVFWLHLEADINWTSAEKRMQAKMERKTSKTFINVERNWVKTLIQTDSQLLRAIHNSKVFTQRTINAE